MHTLLKTILVVSMLLIVVGLVTDITTQASGVLIAPHSTLHVLPATYYTLYGPYIQNLNYLWQYTTTLPMYEALLNGQVQVLNSLPTTQLSQSQIASLKNNPNLYLYDSQTFSFIFLQFNFKYYPENNTYFRWAISDILNPSSVESQILEGGLLGATIPFYINPSVYPSYINSTTLTELSNIYNAHESYNIQRAKTYLQDAGLVYNPSLGEWTYSNGTPLKITIYIQEGFYNCPAWESIIEAGAQQVGLQNNIQFIPYAASQLETILQEQTYDIINYGWEGITFIVPEYYFIFGPGAPYNSFNDFVNSTINAQLTQAYTADPTFSQVVNNFQNALVELQYTEPYVILGWNTCPEPVYTNNYYGYVSSLGDGITNFQDVHEGFTSNGTLNYVIGTYDFAPPNFNIYFENFYSSELIWEVYWYPSTLTSLPSNPTLFNTPYIANYTVIHIPNATVNGHLIINGTEIVYNFVHNATWLNGMPVTALDYNFTIWYLDMGGFSSNPYNPSQDTVFIGDYCGEPVYINYTAEASDPSPIWFDAMPNLVTTIVPSNNPYQIQIYFNTTSYFTLCDTDEVVLPPYLFVNINPLELAPVDGQYTYHITELGEVPGGFPFYPYSYNASTGITLRTYAGYFQFNPLANLINVSAGSSYTLTVNMTQIVSAPYLYNGKPTGPYEVPISNASGVIEIMPYGSSKVIETIPLTHVSGSIYQATISTSGLSPNTPYTIFVNATYSAPITINGSALSTGGTHTMMTTRYFYRWYSIYPYSPTVIPVKVINATQPLKEVSFPSAPAPVTTNVTKVVPPSAVVPSNASTLDISMIAITVILSLIGVVVVLKFK
ncbi:ABC transporter substrate-binding protein [Acidianus manzaensis]|uniref:Solute-binding protein family 5 domain-containing protein n=1 Tax=Acidianus manzaensis TaxID=282676 RepID=A0A1W6JYT8_9CREN|nr:ABC transporter substrate-binding protein [Acidianus manzaensis]ARM75364.1 hypothetical protein B6F84_04520 [Acidianus manzaensis]